MKYKLEIDKMIEEALREPWMEDDDWQFIKSSLENHPKFNLERMEKDIDIGIKNGYTLEDQMNLCRDILIKMKDE